MINPAILFSANPGLREALQCDHPIVRDIRERFDRYGAISDKQVALVLRLAQEASQPREPHVPAPTGSTTFKGIVVSQKQTDGPLGRLNQDRDQGRDRPRHVDRVWHRTARHSVRAHLCPGVSDRRLARC